MGAGLNHHAKRKIKRRLVSHVRCSISAVLAVLAWLAIGDQYAVEAATVGFYKNSCPNAEAIVLRVVKARFAQNPTVTAALLRMLFHDCFVSGCDASILIDSTPKNTAEKEAGANLTVREWDLIDQVKTALEQECPGIVSCADIIVYATRDSIALSGGPNFAIGGGRRDGLISKIESVDLPGPSSTMDEAQLLFTQNGLSSDEMVALFGAHTTGFSHCSFFSDRLFDFQGTGGPDPSLDPELVRRLSRVCPNLETTASSADPAVALDQGTRDAFDASYYRQIRQGRAILQIDQELAADPRTKPLVSAFASSPQTAAFFPAFVRAFLKMADLRIKTAPAGEIRLDCRRVNPPTKTTPPKKDPPKEKPPTKTTPPKKDTPKENPPKRPTPNRPPKKPSAPTPKKPTTPKKTPPSAPKRSAAPPAQHPRRKRSRSGKNHPKNALPSKMFSQSKPHHHSRHQRSAKKRTN